MIIERYVVLYSLKSYYFIYFLPSGHGLYRAGIIAILELRTLWYEGSHILQITLNINDGSEMQIHVL